MTRDQDRRLCKLMQQAQSGDGVAYKALLKEVVELLRRFIRRRVSSSEAAEEIVQETLFSLHRARHTYRSEMLFGPWLYAIAHRRIADYFRRVSRERIEESAERERVENISAPETDSPAELSESLLVALAKLSPEQRQVIKMLKVEDLSVKETAKQLGMSESAVKVTAHRGYTRLRQLFGIDGNAN